MSVYAQIIDFLLAGLENEAGNPLSGGKVDSYNAGLGTRKDTYTVRDKSAVSTNPIILDVYGRAVVYGDGLYKFVIKDASDNVIKTIDNYNCLDVADHSARHEDGGDDEIDLTGLTGELNYPWVDVRDYASLQAAVATIAGTVTTLLIPNAQTLTANVVIPTTLKLWITKGGSIVHTHPFTVTINGPFEAGLYTVFTGFSSGDVTFGLGSVREVQPIWFENPITQVGVNYAIASLTKGKVILPDTSFTITSKIITKSNVDIEGYGDNTVITLGANSKVIEIDGKDNINLRNFKINGVRATYTTDTNVGIDSPANGTGSTNITIDNVTVSEVAGQGIMFLAQTGSHSRNIRILNSKVLNTGCHGIIAQDYVDDVLISNNRVLGYGSTIGYPGITAGRTAVNSQILGCYIEDTTPAFDPAFTKHGISVEGEHAIVLGNIVRNTVGYGIEIAANHSVVDGNDIYGGSRGQIVISGLEDVQKIDAVAITGNHCNNSGAQGIYTFMTDFVEDYHTHIVIVGNVIIGATQVGIDCAHTINSVIANNVIVSSGLSGIIATADRNLDINSNMLVNNNTTAAAGHMDIKISGGSAVRINGFIERHLGNWDTSGTGEDNLSATTISQHYNKSYRGLRIKAAGIKTGGGGNKTLKMYFGTSSFTFNVAANDTNDWRLECEMRFLDNGTGGCAEQYLTWIGLNGTTLLQGWENWTQDMTAGDITLKVTGECANAGDLITQTMWMVETF